MHELNFEIKRKLEASQDSIAEREKEHLEKMAELDSQLLEKVSSIEQLRSELTLEKMQSAKLEEQRSDMLKKYEEEKAAWGDLKLKIEA